MIATHNAKYDPETNTVTARVERRFIVDVDPNSWDAVSVIVKNRSASKGQMLAIAKRWLNEMSFPEKRGTATPRDRLKQLSLLRLRSHFTNWHDVEAYLDKVESPPHKLPRFNSDAEWNRAKRKAKKNVAEVMKRWFT